MTERGRRVVRYAGARREACVRIPVAWQRPLFAVGTIPELRYDGGKIVLAPAETPP